MFLLQKVYLKIYNIYKNSHAFSVISQIGTRQGCLRYKNLGNVYHKNSNKRK